MERYASKLDDGTLYVEDDGGWLEVGELDDVVELVGGPTYSIRYDDYGQAVDWTDTDEDGVQTFDVRETVVGMSYREEFVTDLADQSLDLDDDGYPERTVYFAERMTEIWDSKGNLDANED